MKQLQLFMLTAAVLAVFGGCQGGGLWMRPGPAPEQRQVAQRFDPYPDQDIAPDIVGGRPRDYQQPLAEPARARWAVPGVRP